MLFNIFASDEIDKFDQLEKQGRYVEALDFLISKIKEEPTSINLRWKAAFMTFEIAEALDNKKEKVKYYDIGIEFTKNYINEESLNKRDRVEMIHWYMVNYASKMKTLGIFAGKEALDVIPEIIKAMDKCISIDPTYPGSYFFKGKLYMEVPFFLGGDKKKVDENLLKAIELVDSKQFITLYVNAAVVFLQRDWSSEKKKKELVQFQNNNEYLNLSDKEYATFLLKRVINEYERMKEHSYRDTIYYKKAIILLDEINRKK